MDNAPCYKCPDRTLVCHASCVAYREWLDKYRAEQAAAKVAADADAHTRQTIARNTDRAKTKRRVGQR